MDRGRGLCTMSMMRNAVVCALPEFTADTLSAIKAVRTWQSEVCLSEVIWWCWWTGADALEDDL